MDSKLKFTDVPEESSFYDLVSGDNVLEIPLFQRPYMWKESHYKALLDDIGNIDDETNSSVFLGVIVSFSRGSGPGRPPTWMIVDGQQRITTLYLNVMAAVEVSARAGELDWAADIMGRYLLLRYMSGLTVNTKLIPSFNDRAQFSSIWQRISEIKNFSNHRVFASNPPSAPVLFGPETGAMVAQYNRIKADLSKLMRDHGLEALSNRIDIITNRLSVVSISLRDPTIAPKIFERLNYGAEPVTVADLVRNEVFARAGDDPVAAKHLFDTRWEPFVGRFSEKGADLNRFLFPYGLIHNSNVRKVDLFGALRKIWEAYGSPKKIIDDLEQYQPAYLAVAHGVDYEFGNYELSKRIKRLFRSGCPSSIYPFVLIMLRMFETERLSQDRACVVIDCIESFLVRRAIVGIEPTGLHAVFKGLWRDLVPNIDAQNFDEFITPVNFKKSVADKPTVVWPSDQEFEEAILSSNLYRKKIANYAVREYEVGLKGESPSDEHQIEHIAPQTPTASWSAAIPSNYENVIHLWGNLLPLTANMNPSVGQTDFVSKRDVYAESIFASARAVSKTTVWTEESIRERSKLIAAWALERWKY